jgi:hypothetical protein
MWNLSCLGEGLQMRYVEKGLIGCIDERFHDCSNGSNGAEEKAKPEPMHKARAEVHILAQALVTSREFFT